MNTVLGTLAFPNKNSSRCQVGFFICVFNLNDQALDLRVELGQLDLTKGVRHLAQYSQNILLT